MLENTWVRFYKLKDSICALGFDVAYRSKLYETIGGIPAPN